eukprot:CAMPEP_0184725412 /NCGR_PEP_ID=MMETSP0314-20130426/30896_1 /TAXON_ID=38298 /ORGANISM="Rhodella maculata, Strain CCMP 736" /LENGTH=31 /DNA_ID= /DNA_START= /DNA_END= /DNA_ORIENTATION=
MMKHAGAYNLWPKLYKPYGTDVSTLSAQIHA